MKLDKERFTRLMDRTKRGGGITSDLSALYEILRSHGDVKTRRDAAAYLLKLIDENCKIDPETVNALYDAEKDITVSTALKRIQNKIRLRRSLSKEPSALYDRKLSPEETAKLHAEIARLRGLYDKFHNLKGDFDKKYHCCEMIGEGGMAKIFRAVRREDNREVAIKYLLHEALSRMADPERVTARFRREGELLTKRLNHPHILKGYEYGEADGEHFIVLEYVDGGSVAGLIAAQPVDFPLFREIALQICNAVGYIHRQGVIHRDIKPSNVLIKWEMAKSEGASREGPGRAGSSDAGFARKRSISIKLADFGLAKDKRDARLSRITFKAGTDDFSSPQQLEDARGADERDDIFSMGKTFYEMLTGRSLKNDEPYRPVDLCDSRRSDAVNALILKCIAQERQDRWQGVEELEAALRSIE